MLKTGKKTNEVQIKRLSERFFLIALFVEELKTNTFSRVSVRSICAQNPLKGKT